MRERRERKRMQIIPTHSQQFPRCLPHTTIINTMTRYKQTVLSFLQSNRASTSASDDIETVPRTRRSMTIRKRREKRRDERQTRQVERIRNTTNVIQSTLSNWLSPRSVRTLRGRIRRSESRSNFRTSLHCKDNLF